MVSLFFFFGFLDQVVEIKKYFVGVTDCQHCSRCFTSRVSKKKKKRVSCFAKVRGVKEREGLFHGELP